MLEWLGIFFRGLFYAISILLMFPILMLCRVDRRMDYADDIAFGYDDDDLGEDVDEHEY